METERKIIYRGEFTLPEWAQTWKIYNVGPKGGWHYVNNGGREEDIFFRFEPDAATCEETRDAWLISPPISLERDRRYEAVYQIRLFGIDYSSKTALTIGKVDTPVAGDGVVTEVAPDAMTGVLENCEWEIDGFQWPISTVAFTVEADGYYCIGLHVLNSVAVQLDWLQVTVLTV